MRPVDASTMGPAAARDGQGRDDSQAATQFGDSLRAASHRTEAVGAREQDAGTPAQADTAGADQPDFPRQSRDARPAWPKAETACAGPQAAARPSLQTPRTPPTASGREAAAARRGASNPEGDIARAPAPQAAPAQGAVDAAVDPREARPRTQAAGHDRDAHGNTRRRRDTPQPPDGVALQTLLAAAHPLLAASADAAAAAAPSALTPHDVAASVTQAWLREPSSQDAAGTARGAQWTFTLGDPLTPLASLRISGDAAAGWGLRLTSGNGLPARELALHTERLRRRLRARGQAVDRLEVDDDPQR
jgi:hypothetical protein